MHGRALRRALVAGVLGAALVGACAPVWVLCGAPGITCATAPDAEGCIHYRVDVEPFAVRVLEALAGDDLPFRYHRTSTVRC
ncbi:MAG: hypothetical protein ACRDU8_00835 [Egibacteraceae bacterium]